jgi:hypothetical protein
MTKHDPHITVERFTVSIESELALAVRKAAEADEQNVSAWLAGAASSQRAAFATWSLSGNASTARSAKKNSQPRAPSSTDDHTRPRHGRADRPGPQ